MANLYVDGVKLHKVMTDYHNQIVKAEKEGKPLPQVPEFVGECILKICTNFARLSDYVRYSYKDEMIDDAVVGCVYGASKFDPSKSTSNAFNYFSMITYHSFLQRIDKERKQNYIRHSNFVKG
jgi:hypothetical protein